MDYDDAYANAAYIPNAADYPGRWQRCAASFRDNMRLAGQAHLDVAYSVGMRAKLDIFMPPQTPCGILIFVHGGYWLKFDKSYWSHLAAGPVARGWAVAIPSYDLCPNVRIAQITQQISQAVTHIADRIAGPVVLGGHSAGGHLVARMLAPEIFDAPLARRIKRVVTVSPVADLRPLLHTAMNAELQLDAAQAVAESPVLQGQPSAPVTVWVGELEWPAFLAQARGLATAWQAALVISPEQHHFNVIEDLALVDSGLTNAMLTVE